VSNYTYRGTHTVKNTFGVTDYDELECIAAAIVKARYTEIDAGSGPIGNSTPILSKRSINICFKIFTSGQGARAKSS
jgi:hypothetical protein